MDYLKAKFFLNKLSTVYTQQKLEIPKDKIKKKIENIKYLSSQKKVPRLSLRKEIINLENQLKSIYQVEKSLNEQKKTESVKVASLKRQISRMKGQCSQEKVKDLQKTIDQLSFILSETLAKQKVAEDVNRITKVPLQPKVAEETERSEEEKAEKARMLQQKLMILKQELERIKREKKVDPSRAASYEQMISAAENKLSEYGVIYSKPKHTLMFHTPPPEKHLV